MTTIATILIIYVVWVALLGYLVLDRDILKYFPGWLAAPLLFFFASIIPAFSFAIFLGEIVR